MTETVVPRKTYILVWLALMTLLLLTVGVSYVHLGRFNAVAAVAIAVVKAVIIMAYFMHLRQSPRLIWVVVGAGFFWLGIMFVLSFGDFLTRSYLPAPTVW